MRTAKIGPKHIHKYELGIGRLPDQEIAETKLPAGADHNVRIRQTRRIEMRLERMLIDRLGL